MDPPGTIASTSDTRATASENCATARPPTARQYQPLVVVVFGAATGIIVDRYARPDLTTALPSSVDVTIAALPLAPLASCFALWWLLATTCLCGWWCLYHAERNRAAVCLLIAAVAFTSAAWHDWHWYLFHRDEIARYATSDSTPTMVEVVARQSPERVPAARETPLRAIPSVERSRLLVDILRIRDGTRWRPAKGLCQLALNGHLLGVGAGDRLRICGQLGRIRPSMNPGEFDFAAHARSDRELVRMNCSAPECVTILNAATSLPGTGMLDRVRRHFELLVLRYVGPNQAGLASAILLGSRAALPREETDPYFLTGTIHVLVVSGMNVAILTGALIIAMRFGWLPRRFALLLIGALAIAYALLAEGQPPVTRAAVVVVLMCVASWTARPATAFNSLAGAALFALALNPTDLFRVGPQLSFLAVATLIWLGHWRALRRALPTDRLDELLAAARPWYVRAMSWLSWQLGITMTIALVVWLAAVPLVLYQFNLVTPVAVLISPLVSACVVVALYSGFMLLVGADLVPQLAELLGAICAAALSSLEAIVLWGESLPASHFWSPSPTWWWIAGFYLGLLAVMLYGRALAPPRWQVALLCGWIVMGLIPPLSRSLTRNQFDCAFLSVGHGACVVLQSPSGHTLLYDAGSLASPELATQSIAAYLWHRGITRIDGIVLSHADIDHYNAVPGLLDRFPVGAIYVSPMMFEEFGEGAGRSGPAELRRAIARANVPIREVWAGDHLRLDSSVDIAVLHPPRSGVLGSDNANSITLTVEHDGRRILLPGDLESPGIEDVLAEQAYDCDILLAPHHGSRRSDPPGFASWSTPEWVVVSGPGGSQVRPVVNAYQQQGAVVLLSHELGTIEFLFEERRLLSECFRGASKNAAMSKGNNVNPGAHEGVANRDDQG